jgi:hypothetical protein
MLLGGPRGIERTLLFPILMVSDDEKKEGRVAPSSLYSVKSDIGLAHSAL